MMTALPLHAYASGLYSSRRIEKACIELPEFMMTLVLDPPEFRTISGFCKRYLNALAALLLRLRPASS